MTAPIPEAPTTKPDTAIVKALFDLALNGTGPLAVQAMIFLLKVRKAEK